jgi:hypothetical protein
MVYAVPAHQYYIIGALGLKLANEEVGDVRRGEWIGLPGLLREGILLGVKVRRWKLWFV